MSTKQTKGDGHVTPVRSDSGRNPALLFPIQNQNTLKKIFFTKNCNFVQKTCNKTRFPAYIWEDFFIVKLFL